MKTVKNNIRLSVFIIYLMFVVCGAKADNVVSVLYYPEDITFASNQLVLMRDGIYIMEGTRLASLETDGDVYDMSANLKDSIDDIINTDIGEIVKAGRSLFIVNDTLVKLMLFDKEDFNIYPYQGEMIFLTYKDGTDYILCKVNLIKRNIVGMLKLPDMIVSVTYSEGNLFIATEKNIYMFDDHNTCTKLLSSWEPFHDTVLTGCGLLFGSENNICLVTDVETFIPLLQVGCKKMYYYEDFLYVYTPDNALLKINFKELERILEIRNKTKYLLPSEVLIELR